MTSVATVQAIENADGVHLYAFDAQEECVFAFANLHEHEAGSLARLMSQCLNGEIDSIGTPIANPVLNYLQVTDESRRGEIIAEHDHQRYVCYEADMGRAGLRLSGTGYVLGLLHMQDEGNWFEHAGEGSIWQHVFASPVAAESVLDEFGLDCEIHAIPDLIQKGCRLDEMRA